MNDKQAEQERAEKAIDRATTGCRRCGRAFVLQVAWDVMCAKCRREVRGEAENGR
jgi:Zn finger protein HypA/HybF involved in hydrogenase expression